ncbi:hypothetical protein SK128_020094 [Halocaridina rubra]|uniref:Chitin-binding type-2 domain-containing protein n=1 Tax=Halocaridina rubra TaxID=373956 RepID=A0AAN8X426_HALRR
MILRSIIFIFVFQAFGSRALSAQIPLSEDPCPSNSGNVFLRATPYPPPVSVVAYCANLTNEETANLPDYLNCHAYWHCENKVPTWCVCTFINQTQQGFDPNEEKCVPSWAYPCHEGSVSPRPTTEVTAPNTNTFSTTSSQVTGSSSTSSRTSVGTPGPVGSTTFYPPGPVDCPPGQDVPETILSACANSPSEDFNLPFNGNCHWFWHCSGGNAFCRICGYFENNQMVFNPIITTCDLEWHYPCNT